MIMTLLEKKKKGDESNIIDCCKLSSWVKGIEEQYFAILERSMERHIGFIYFWQAQLIQLNLWTQESK